jgi:cystathionine beta-synthase
MKDILDTIGRTPLVPLSLVGRGSRVPILGKCEHLNPGGSVKDRIAVAIVDRAEHEGLLKPGGVLVEATAGNTGIGLALVAALRGYSLLCVMPEKMSEDKRQALRALGAEVVITDNVPPGDPKHFQSVAKRLASERENAFWTDQFGNQANPDIHERTTGPELWEQTEGKIAAFVTGVGTGGTITGVGRYLKQKNPDIQIVLADPVGSRLAGLVNEGELGEDGNYLVEGIGTSVVPDVLDLSVVDFAVSVSDKEGFEMTHRLIREEGLLVGGSSGFSVVAALKAAERLTVKGPVVALLQDSWDRYWSKLFDPDWMADNVG